MNESIRDVLRGYLLEASKKDLPTKKGRPHFSILGKNNGSWKLISGYDIGWSRAYDWHVAAALSSKNKWKTLMVDNATESHTGFLKAFNEAVAEYPDLKNYIISFDGPFMPVSNLVGSAVETDWSKITFYHGTSDAVWQLAKKEGLRPRSATKASAAYGSAYSAQEGSKDAVYLTTQLNTALFAARDAARNTKSLPRVLIVKGIDGSKLIPDIDSGEKTALASMQKIGAVGYLGTISHRLIKLRK